VSGPSLDFDWEQALFRTARSLWRGLFSAPEPERSAAAVRLEDHQASWLVLARVLGGEKLRIVSTPGVGGIRGADLLLPAVLDLAPTAELNRDLYLYRVVLGALLAANPRPAGTLLEQIQHSYTALHAAADTLPHLAALHHRCVEVELRNRPALDGLSGLALTQESAIRAALAGDRPWEQAQARAAFAKPLAVPEVRIWGRAIALALAPSEGSDNTDAPPAAESSEAEALDVDDIQLLQLSEEDVVELPVHVFEKVETLDEWSGGARPMDGSDELDDHLEALDELDLRDLIRGGEQARSVLKADVALDLEIPDVARIAPDETGIPYPEWDRRRKRYREDWTTVYPTPLPCGPDAWAKTATEKWQAEIEALRVQLRMLHDSLRPRPRQLDGEAFDIDAIVGELSARRAGHGGDQRLYRRLQRQDWDLATTVLLDLSLSSDGWVDGRRVLDVARESLLVLGEVMADFALPLRIIAFASQTRNQIRAWDVLHWNEPWSKARARMGLLHPQGYTRIGPAIRHAAADLHAQTSRRKLLILLSDGKPTDYDRYEGRYGVADVRQAIRDARSDGIRVHALAIDSHARDVLPVMLGRGAWDLLPSPDLMPPVLTTLTARMAIR